MKGMKIGILMTMLMFLVASASAQAPPNVWTADSSGTLKNYFKVNVDIVHVAGTGLPADTYCDLYVVSNPAWIWSGGETIPADVTGSVENVKTDGSGNLPTTAIWSPATATGGYDIVVDCINYGTYEINTDGVDYFDTGSGCYVVPESVIAVALIALLVPGMIYVVRKRK